jgi:hypothetical protein
MAGVLYIAGPMRGYPRFNFDEFYRIEGLLLGLDLGYEVINPARLDECNGFNPGVERKVTGPEIEAFVRRDIESVLRCNAIVLLKGWDKSHGAIAEFYLARWLSKAVVLNVGIQAREVVFMRLRDLDLAASQNFLGSATIFSASCAAERPIFEEIFTKKTNA